VRDGEDTGPLSSGLFPGVENIDLLTSLEQVTLPQLSKVLITGIFSSYAYEGADPRNLKAAFKEQMKPSFIYCAQSAKL
jgi:hypothetical protein